jgi:hypothetical protein
MALRRRHWLALPLSNYQRKTTKQKDVRGIYTSMKQQESTAQENGDPEPPKVWALYVVTIGGSKPQARLAIAKATGLGQIFTTEHPASFFQAFYGDGKKKPGNPKKDAYWFPYEIVVADYMDSTPRDKSRWRG